MQDYIEQMNSVKRERPLKVIKLAEFSCDLKKGQRHLLRHDAVLRKLIINIGDCRLKPHKKYFENLVDGIVSQQLSVKVAETIFRRFKNLFKNKSSNSNRFPLPNEIISMPDEKIRACGLSNSKVRYIKDLASHVFEGKIKIRQLNQLSDNEIINELIQVKGIGVWTAQMFLIFCLGRMNVLPVGDLGLKRAVMINYNMRKLPIENRVKKISKLNCWHPYNSIATWYLWQSLSLKPKLVK